MPTLNPLNKLKTRLNHLQSTLQNELQQLRKASISTTLLPHLIKDCVQDAQHRELLYAMAQLGLDVVIDSRAQVTQHIAQYLAKVRPAEIAGLTRIGGFSDGGYVMLPPPPPVPAKHSS